ncbi:FliO/MopB family protein [Sulfurivermis fontis]|uniref:FliO/MopB family protein n=1 Tax=Sulfurivermis fontis TaxID=1972068 RepID=UPI001558EB6B|nr:flagellar biosynthetic protein FliO [Sulfurivermis fontis]
MLGGVPVGQRERVVLIQVGNKQLLLGVAPGRVQTLHVLDEPINVTAVPSGGESFAERLTAALKKSGRS